MGYQLKAASSLAIIFSIAATTAYAQEAKSNNRVLARTAKGELYAEISKAPNWCQPDLTFSVHGDDDRYFKEGEQDEKGRRGRILLQKLIGAIRIGLERECPKVKSITINGFVDDVPIFRGYASKATASNDWILMEVPLIFAELPAPAPSVSPPAAQTATSAPTLSMPTMPAPAASMAVSPPPSVPTSSRLPDPIPAPPVGSGPALPHPEVVAACHALAAHPYDPWKEKGVTGVEDDQMNAGAAVAACEDARLIAPGDIRIQYQLARAYLLYDRLSEGADLMAATAEEGHPVAIATLGDFVLYGLLGDPPDPEAAQELYLQAAEAGFEPAIELAEAIEENPQEDSSQKVNQEDLYHNKNLLNMLSAGDKPNQVGIPYAMSIFYGMWAMDGISRYCPEIIDTIPKEQKTEAHFAIKLRNKLTQADFSSLDNITQSGEFNDFKQEALSDGHELAISKGCTAKEIRRFIETVMSM